MEWAGANLEDIRDVILSVCAPVATWIAWRQHRRRKEEHQREKTDYWEKRFFDTVTAVVTEPKASGLGGVQRLYALHELIWIAEMEGHKRLREQAEDVLRRLEVQHYAIRREDPIRGYPEQDPQPSRDPDILAAERFVQSGAWENDFEWCVVEYMKRWGTKPMDMDGHRTVDGW